MLINLSQRKPVKSHESGNISQRLDILTGEVSVEVLAVPATLSSEAGSHPFSRIG